MRLLVLTLVTALSAAACRPSAPPRLTTGSVAPDFTLPGTDGRSHILRDFSGRRVLAVVFTDNSCPAAQLYETRLKKLEEDYRSKGLAVVAINPMAASAMEPRDLRYSDVGESIDDMKVRASYRHLEYPYLADAAQMAAANAYRVTTLPHIFVFDQARTLQYDGRIDDSLQEDRVRSADARQAIDALLAGRPVPVSRTEPTGCAVKSPASDPARANDSGAGPIAVELAGADILKALRRNEAGALHLINFWATWCAPCAAEFPDLETTYRMYKGRGLTFTTVSVNDPGERDAVLAFLRSHGAAHRNLLFATSDVYELQAAFDPEMPAPVPFTLLLGRGGSVLYQELGELDILKLRRAILANLPDDSASPGLQAYWAAPVR